LNIGGAGSIGAKALEKKAAGVINNVFNIHVKNDDDGKKIKRHISDAVKNFGGYVI